MLLAVFEEPHEMLEIEPGRHVQGKCLTRCILTPAQAHLLLQFLSLELSVPLSRSIATLLSPQSMFASDCYLTLIPLLPLTRHELPPGLF